MRWIDVLLELLGIFGRAKQIRDHDDRVCDAAMDWGPRTEPAADGNSSGRNGVCRRGSRRYRRHKDAPEEECRKPGAECCWEFWQIRRRCGRTWRNGCKALAEKEQIPTTDDECGAAQDRGLCEDARHCRNVRGVGSACSLASDACRDSVYATIAGQLESCWKPISKSLSQREASVAEREAATNDYRH